MHSQPHVPFSRGLRADRDQFQVSRRWLSGNPVELNGQEPSRP